MRRSKRTIVFLAAALAAAGAALSCGSPASEGHHAEKGTPAPAPPTPDTTPFASLRTPAGMVIRLDAPTPTPAPTK